MAVAWGLRLGLGLFRPRAFVHKHRFIRHASPNLLVYKAVKAAAEAASSLASVAQPTAAPAFSSPPDEPASVSSVPRPQAPNTPSLVGLPTSNESEDLLRIRHSVSGGLVPIPSCRILCDVLAEALVFMKMQCAHIMAMAVQRLYKGVQVCLGCYNRS
jgi:hypothetical protein